MSDGKNTAGKSKRHTIVIPNTLEVSPKRRVSRRLSQKRELNNDEGQQPKKAEVAEWMGGSDLESDDLRAREDSVEREKRENKLKIVLKKNSTGVVQLMNKSSIEEAAEEAAEEVKDSQEEDDQYANSTEEEPKPAKVFDSDDDGMDAMAGDGQEEEQPQIQEMQPSEDNDIVDPRNLTNHRQVIRHCEDLIKKWIIPPEQRLTDLERAMMLWGNFKEVDVNDLQSEILDLSHEKIKLDITSHIVSVIRMQHLIGEENSKHLEAQLVKALKISEDIYGSLQGILLTKHRTYGVEIPGISHLLPSKSMTSNPKQELTKDLYRRAAARGYRKFGGQLFEPIKTANGISTHSYRKVTDIRKFITSNCNRHTNEINWQHVTGGRRGTMTEINDIAESMEAFQDYELPDLVRDRHKFSFANGVLLTRLERGKKSGMRTDVPRSLSTVFYSRFIPYDHPDFKFVSEEKSSAKYFENEYEDHSDKKDWYDIPTPTLDRILHYQFGKRDDYEEISRHIYYEIGRAMFALGDLDNYQYALYFKGIAGTGKSTILEYILKRLYLKDNVAEVNNNIEAKFGLGGLRHNRDIYITTFGELDHRCELELPSLLCMISGEEVVSAVKNEKSAIIMPWPAHMYFAGNNFPSNWNDTGGNVTRRFLLVLFNRKVHKKHMQTNLKDLLALEMPNIMQKSVRAYHEKINKYRTGTVWDFCPKYFEGTTADLKSMTNYLQTFMMDPAHVAVGGTLVTSETDLMNEFKAYAKLKGVSSRVSSKDVSFNQIVQELSEDREVNIEYVKMHQQLYEGQLIYGQMFFTGLGLVSKWTEAEKKVYFLKLEKERRERRGEPEEPEEEEDKDSKSPEEGPVATARKPKGKEEEDEVVEDDDDDDSDYKSDYDGEREDDYQCASPPAKKNNGEDTEIEKLEVESAKKAVKASEKESKKIAFVKRSASKSKN